MASLEDDQPQRRRQRPRRKNDRKGDRRLRDLAISAFIGYMILLTGGGIGLAVLEHRDADRNHAAVGKARAAIRKAQRAEVQTCRRVKRLRRQANGSSQIIFATLWVSAIRERHLAQGPRSRTHSRSARQLESLARRATRTDQTNCLLAVYEPKQYAPPAPEPFDPRTDPLVRFLMGL